MNNRDHEQLAQALKIQATELQVAMDYLQRSPLARRPDGEFIAKCLQAASRRNLETRTVLEKHLPEGSKTQYIGEKERERDS